MNNEQLGIFKAALNKRALNGEQWKDWAKQASQICSAYMETLQQTEPYATSTISWFEEVSGELQEITDGGDLE